jgi:glycolate oxidase iron-sulfur subunit
MDQARPSRLKKLDYSFVQQCMHCGLCLPTCPTYDITKLERHSPRGRISLMRAIADGRLEPAREFGREMYFCLGCYACVTACPAGVNYAELFEESRAEVEEQRLLDRPARRFVRHLTIHWLFMDLHHLQWLGRVIRLWQSLGLQALVRRSGVLRLLPKRLQGLEAMTPTIQPQYTAELLPPVLPAVGPRKYRVALLAGCAQDIIFSNVNCDTAEVLARNGCEVHTPPEQSCCGSLHSHNGEMELARQLAIRNLEQFPPAQYDAIISNAGGCGSHLKHYSAMFGGDSPWKETAALWDKKVKDIHEWLIEIGVAPPSSAQPAMRVTYHESCHLSHGQKIVAQPRQVLRSIPNLELVELPEANWCCGSAGIYNVIQPETAGKLLERKLDWIAFTKATVVATGNPGCLLQVANGARQRGMPLRVAHPVTLLAEAYRRG